MLLQRIGQRGWLAVAVTLMAISTAHAAPFNAAGHWVASDYSGSGDWNNRNTPFNDASPMAISGNYNATPALGVSINGHGSVFFNANGDGNLNTGAAFGVTGSAAVNTGGTNPTSGARRITMSAVFQTRGGVAGRAGNHWQNSGILGNERPGGGRGDWGLTYEGSQASGFQADVETVSPTGGFNNDQPHIVSYNIDNSGNTQLWVDGRLETSIVGGANFIAANGTNTLENVASESNFSIGVSTGANCCGGGDQGFIHGDLAEVRIDSFSAPSAGASVNLNSAEIVALHNHLSSKYNSTMTANDFYAGDTPGNGNYDNGVTGIVGISGTKLSSSNDSWLTSLNSSGLTVNEVANSVADNEGVFAGHNQLVDTGIAPNSLVTTGGFTRSSRVWFVDETGSVDFSLTFDLSDMGLSFSSTPVLLFANSSALNFNPLAITPTISGDQYTYDLSSIANADGYYTLAAAVPEPTTVVTWLLFACVGIVWGGRRFAMR